MAPVLPRASMPSACWLASSRPAASGMFHLGHTSPKSSGSGVKIDRLPHCRQSQTSRRRAPSALRYPRGLNGYKSTEASSFPDARRIQVCGLVPHWETKNRFCATWCASGLRPPSPLGMRGNRKRLKKPSNSIGKVRIGCNPASSNTILNK